MNARVLGRLLPNRVVHGGPADQRLRRYATAAVIGCGAAWGVSGAYLTLSPDSYTSGFVLVLPGTGAGTSVNLPTLGQATSTSSSPFASPELSPTENYRKMLLSQRLIAGAARLAQEPEDRFPVPKVELADQTKLISVKVTARSADQAARRSEAIRTAFLGMLDALREDEIQTRDSAYRQLLAGYRTSLNEGRQKLIDYEASTGLVSLDQYSSIVSSVEKTREILRETETRLSSVTANADALMRQLGVTADQANIAMVLRSDPLFQSLLDQLSKEDTQLAALGATHGPANAQVADLTAERAATAAKLNARAQDLTGNRKLDVLKFRDLSIHDERARLFEQLVTGLSEAEGLRATCTSLSAQMAAEQQRVAQLAPVVSRLDDLKRNVQVAEAVFSSALARIDTSKSDYFASYPMVQTLERPEIPSRRSGPLPMLATAGGLAATFLIIASLVLTWLRTALLQRILKNA
jgi:uncharacterized protein involved in exopolysaccharide biosynthesis